MKGRIGVATALVWATAALAPLTLGAASVAAEDPTTLTIGTTVAIDNPTIWAVNSTTEWMAVNLQYDMLMKFSDEDLSAAPGLATGCEPSPDYRRWTCAIPAGLTWSDGLPLTSKDVAFSYRFVIDQGFPYFEGYFPKDVTFETPDDTTIVWVSPEPTRAPVVPAWSYIVPEHIWGPYAGKTNKEIKQAEQLPTVASGPYVMTEAVPGQSWTFERNPYFRGPRPNYDRIVFRLYTNQEAMVQALKNGEVQIADGLASSLLPAVQSIPNVAVQKVTSDTWINLAFNFGGQDPASKPLPALQDLNVRKAIEMAIDKQAIVDKVYQGAAAPGETIIRPLSVYWHLDIPDDGVIGYDPAAANALLDQTGYAMGPDGIRVDPKTGEPLVLRMPTSNDTAGSEAAGRMIASYLKQIGIQVDVQPVSAGKMYDIQQSGDFDAYIWYWSGDPDPNYQLSVFTSGACGDLSDGCWRDDTYDAIFAQQGTELDQDKRLALVRQAQQYIYDQVPVVVIAYPNWLVAYRTDLVTDLTPVPGKDGYLTPAYSYTSMVTARPADATQPDPTATSSVSAGPQPSATSPGSASSPPATPSGPPAWFWVLVAALGGFGVGVVVARRRAIDRPDTY